MRDEKREKRRRERKKEREKERKSRHPADMIRKTTAMIHAGKHALIRLLPPLKN